jgi:hypothetical protein
MCTVFGIALALAALTLPIFVAIAILAGFPAWMRPGGPAVLLAVWAVMLY